MRQKQYGFKVSGLFAGYTRGFKKKCHKEFIPVAGNVIFSQSGIR